MKFYSKNNKNEIYKEEDLNKLLNNNNEINESTDNFSKDYLILSEKTKKKYSQYISKTLDREKSINEIDLDIERTFQSFADGRSCARCVGGGFSRRSCVHHRCGILD